MIAPDGVRATAATAEVTTYRIGWWTHRWWPRREILRCLATGRQPDGRRVPRGRYLTGIRRDLKRLRRPHRPWQAEYEAARMCPRAFTRAGAHAKAEADRQHLLATGSWSPWVERAVVRRARLAGRAPDGRRLSIIVGRLVITSTPQLAGPRIDSATTTDGHGNRYGSLVLGTGHRAPVVGWRGARAPGTHRWPRTAPAPLRPVCRWLFRARP